MKKKVLSLILVVCMAGSLMAGCGSSSSSSSSSSSDSTETEASDTAEESSDEAEATDDDIYTGIDALEACDWAAEKYPDATVVRYTNNTSTGTFETNGGSIPAIVLYLAVNLPIETEGRYRLELYADGTLAKTADDIVSGLKSGAFEMNCLSTANFSSYTDAFSEMNVPFVFSDEEEVKSILDAGLKDEMCARAEEDIEGVLFKGIATFGFREMTNNKHEITSPEDLEGLKMRVLTDPLIVSAFEAMGASVTNVTYSELYTSLQQGVVDGEENPFQNLVVDKLMEVQDYCTVTDHLYQMSAQVISESFWESLSEEDQEIFERLIEEAEEAGYERMTELQDYYQEECEASGMQITYLTDEQREAFVTLMEKEVYDSEAETMGQDRWDALMDYVETY
ncbi:MAG: TRAP transporter substrate-binding protein [Lachnospiraceae bacterium]|nr:TRAP transporter substrate-binding protein [Lachnospiraceae bacterium]